MRGFTSGANSLVRLITNGTSEGLPDVRRNPADLYELGPAAPDPDGDLAMLYYLDGFIDAGAAGRLLTTHLMSTLEHDVVATFDLDSLLDYRSRRPIMTFAKDHWDDYDAPELAVSLLRDADGTPFLMLAGLEPDREWEAFTAAVRQLAADLRVRLCVGFQGIPMGVPHTRQLGPAGVPPGPGGQGGHRIRCARTALLGPGGISRSRGDAA